MTISKKELDLRSINFISRMNKMCPGWETVFVVSKANQYYFTGTMQDGFLIIKSNGTAIYYVYKSYERALDESTFENIVKINSYREAAEHIGKVSSVVYFETDTVPYSMIERFKKYFGIGKVDSFDKTILMCRAVKTEFEIQIIKEVGEKHNDFMIDTIPALFKEGISEADLYAEVYEKMLKHGSQGIARFQGFQAEMQIGQVAFGESSIYPINSDSPDGAYGMCAAVPLIGRRHRLLKKGDLIFIDLGYGIDGYHTDKTQVFSFGKEVDANVSVLHNRCIDILRTEKSLLKVGNNCSNIYAEVVVGIENKYHENFMGYGQKTVKFLGHGVGLNVDEYPIISKGFDFELEENMVVALEPKIGIEGIGMVGVEETFIVCKNEPICITGGERSIIRI